MSLTVMLALVWCHFIGDFIFQSDDVALNKSKDNVVLFKHVAIYMLPFVWAGTVFYVVNMALHFITDYFSSRACTKLYMAGKRHWFFVVIGLDQAAHMTALFVTYSWLSDIRLFS